MIRAYLVVGATLTFTVAAVAQDEPSVTYPPAEPAVTVQQRVVDSRGLDLDTPRGAHEMLHRINVAARVVCGGAPQFNSMYAVAPEFVTRQFEICRERANTNAAADLGEPEVSWLYEHGQHQYFASLIPPAP